GADQDDPRQVQLALGVSEKAGEEQNGLTRHRNAGIFQKQGHAHRPIAVVIEKIAEEFEQVVRHSVAFPEIVWTLNIVNMWGRFPAARPFPPVILSGALEKPYRHGADGHGVEIPREG